MKLKNSSKNMSKGIYTPDTEIEQAIEKYLQEPKKSTHTIRNRREVLTRFLDDIAEKWDIEKIEDIHPDHIQEYIDQRRRDGMADISIKNEVIHIQGICTKYNHSLNDDIDLSHLDTSPKYRDADGQPPHITVEEYRQLLNEANNLRDECIFRVLWETGIRRAECHRINCQDVNFEENSIDIDSAKEDGYRIVFIDPTTSLRLKKYIEVNRKKYPNYNDTDALFLSEDGMRLSGEHISLKVREAAERAGIQEVLGRDAQGHRRHKVTAHSLRHSFAIHRIDNNMPLKYVAEIMGNSPEVVADTYLNPTPDQLQLANRKSRPNVYSDIEITQDEDFETHQDDNLNPYE